MPIYLVVPLKPENSILDAAVRQHIPAHDSHKLQNDRGWFIKFDGTTIEVSNILTITGQENGQAAPIGSALIVPVINYYGRGPSEMWEWLKTRIEK